MNSELALVLQVLSFAVAALGLWASQEKRFSQILERLAAIEVKLAILWRRVNAEAEGLDRKHGEKTG